MLRIPIILATMAGLSPQASLAAVVPSKLSGTIVMSCVTTDAGAKVDEEIYKIDFVKKQVNNRSVEFEITDISLGWTYLPKRTDGGIDLDGGDAINRYSGKLTSGIQWSNSKRLTVCRVAGARKF